MEQDRVAGIVCEYNPFHRGHQRMIQTLRGQGYGGIVCVMSGPFVQRAEPALLPTPVRVRAALAGGADLVFRLPAPWATASAEAFARGSVALLAGLGLVDVVAFGAENPDVERLNHIAALFEQTDFRAALKEKLAGGLSFAAARAAAAEACRPGSAADLAKPNNILAVEYCKALATLRKKGGKTPSPLALPRLGAAHDGQPQEGVASASWLREQIKQRGLESVRGYLPAACYPIYEDALREGAWMDGDRWEVAALSRLRERGPGDFSVYAAPGEGLAERMAGAAGAAVSLGALYDAVKSKRFAHSAVRRLALSAILQRPAKLPETPPFLHLLGASARGRELLGRATPDLPLSSSLAKLTRHDENCARMAAFEGRCEDLYTLCQHRPAGGGAAFTAPGAFV